MSAVLNSNWMLNYKYYYKDRYSPVLSKKDFVKRYEQGEFGNCSPTWNTTADFLADANMPRFVSGLFHVRNRIAGGKTWYNVPFSKLIHTWREAVEEIGLHNVYLSAMCPTEKTILQGEVLQTEKGLYLLYSTVIAPMRQALAERPEQAVGLKAVSLLRQAMCPNSYEWLNILLERYPEHVVEFTSLSTRWGTLPNFNTLFWEVRKGY